MALLPALLLLVAAPAPLPRRAPAAPCVPPVRCVMAWGGTAYETTFAPGGGYEAVAPGPGGCVWRGAWRLEGRTLVVEESVSPASRNVWRAAMDARCRSGVIAGWAGTLTLEAR